MAKGFLTGESFGWIEMEEGLNEVNRGFADARTHFFQIVREVFLVRFGGPHVVEVGIVFLCLFWNLQSVDFKVPAHLIYLFHLSVFSLLCIVFGLLLKSTSPVKNSVTTHPIDHTSTLLL